jgi:MFS superfamily sulfate permease-like transporter
LFFSDLWAGILAGIGLALGFGIVKIVDVRAGRSGRNLPVIVRRLTAEESKGASCETTADSDAAGRRDSR